MIVHNLIPLSDEQSAVLCHALRELLDNPPRPVGVAEMEAQARELAIAEDLFVQLRPVSGGGA
jgi:hypothetical protein